MSTILVVDDEERILRTYEDILKRDGHQVILCSNIVDARKYLKAVPVDLILLDINMGDFSGDILYEISQCFHRDIKIIVSSVYAVEDQRNLMPQAVDYFDKSEGIKVLIEKVNEALLNNRREEKKNILVVDDDMETRRRYHYLLNKAGYNPVEFSDNEMFLARLESQKDNIDLIVLDLVMPETPGSEYFGVIKKKYPDIKVMISSNYPTDTQKEYVFGADDYFDKADGNKVFMEKIRQLI